MSADDPDSLFWWITRTKRRKMSAFVDEPSRDTFAELVSPYHFSGTRGIADLDAYLAEDVFGERDPAELAEVINAANAADQPSTLAELSAFDWPSATELLRALDPAGHVWVNRKTRDGMVHLGFTTHADPELDDAWYRAFRQDVQEAVDTYNMDHLAARAEDDPVPDWASPFEVADCVFQHAGSSIELDSLVDH